MAEYAAYANILAHWRQLDVRTETDLDLQLENFRVLFAYHSGKIENDEITWHDTREIFENGRAINFTGNPRALFEQQNQRLCYAALRARFAAREPLSLGMIREIHAMLTAGTYDERRFLALGERPGQFKRHDYVIGRAEVGAAPEDVEGELAALLAELEALPPEADTLRAGAYMHARFEWIHPFADGNGRVGRTLLNYFLMLRNHPPLIIYEDEKADYYAALERYDAAEELEPLVNFLQRQTQRAWQRQSNK
ncbi:MAG: Fic family protein [Oscillospiraceae bacterium]|nr:Fic family protein [Oscillospiraceae bacterium]